MSQIPAAERNKYPIWEIMKNWLSDPYHVFEIGSGLGWHALQYCQWNPQLIWQCSEQKQQLEVLKKNVKAFPSPQILTPIEFDVDTAQPYETYDLVFTVNTFHIMPLESVERTLFLAGQMTKAAGRFSVYGPFKYQGQFTTLSNEEFDRYLKQVDSRRGLRDIETILTMANSQGFKLLEDHKMPSNNQLLEFIKKG
ncbi:MAG: DUF938 domain-containing protein [Bdellovibrionales bacterium]|nr:DUF938 domain-containing protein [Bdellovibrionales bacterium]